MKCKKHGAVPLCNEPGCTSTVYWKSDKCIKHGAGDRCTEPGCTKGARIKGGKCRAHKGGERCPNCISWPDSRSAADSYDGYCATCFKHLFPEDPRSKKMYLRGKETTVRNRINAEFEGFIHNTPLYTGHCQCTHRRRIDHRKLIEGTLLCVETDEYAHRSYNPKDEEIRYDDLYMLYSGKWIFIRFNPDGKRVKLETKLDALIATMKEQIGRIERGENNDPVEIIKLFYKEK